MSVDLQHINVSERADIYIAPGRAPESGDSSASGGFTCGANIYNDFMLKKPSGLHGLYESILAL